MTVQTYTDKKVDFTIKTKLRNSHDLTNMLCVS